MLDEVITACPEATLLLNAEWSQNSEIAAYANKARVHWIYSAKFLYPIFSYRFDLTRNCLGGNVVLASLSTAIYMGFDPVYLLGVDLDGLFHDMVDSSSHFYGGPSENAAKEPYKMEMDLRNTAHGFRQWRALAERFEAGSPQIVNLTKGGLLIVFPREDYETVMLNVKS